MATAAAEGKTLLSESRYREAIERFTVALQTSPTSPDYLLQRSTAYQRAKQYESALRDAEAAIVHATTRAKRELIIQGQLRRGIALFHLERYGDARYCLEIVRSKDPKEKSVAMWLSKVDTKVKDMTEDDEKTQVTVKEMPELKAITKTEAASAPAVRPVAQSTPAEKIRHDWYQSNTSVTFILLAKGVPKDITTVDITATSLSISFPVEATGSDFDFTLDPLYAEVDVAKSSYKILPTKIEVILAKATPGQKWTSLEGSDTAPVTVAAPVVEKGPSYPTSSKSGPKNWDRIADDEPVPDDEAGDDATKFFKKLYKDATPETQRAMMKSYYESNGTALSTDWNDVRKGPVATVPPDGMEAKKW